MKYIAILIDGDNENSLGGACSRDIWNISKKLIKEINIDLWNIGVFMHDTITDPYKSKISQLGINNIEQNSLCNIKNYFDFIIQFAKKEKTTIFFHYSGHGYQIPDTDGDEIDGEDEIFLGHSMTDDFIWKNLIVPLPSDATIYALMDACHSGSGLDMPYIWNNEKWSLNKKKDIVASCSGFSISACSDSQCASQDVGDTTGFAGSLTAGFCDYSNFKDFFQTPINVHKILQLRLQKLGQSSELYSIKDS